MTFPIIIKQLAAYDDPSIKVCSHNSVSDNRSSLQKLITVRASLVRDNFIK